MRLLFILPEYPPHAGGGIVTFYRYLLPEFARRGHLVDALVGNAFSYGFQDYEADGVRIRFLDHDVVAANLNKFDHYHAIPELQRHLAAAWSAWQQADCGRGYDLVEMTDWGLLFVPWILEKDSPPTVVQLHGSIGQIALNDPQHGEELFSYFVRLLESQLLPFADELQAYSQTNAQWWGNLIGRDVNYIPPGWLPPKDINTPCKNLATGLVVGRIQYWKGPTILCEALRMLGNDVPIINWLGRDTPYKESQNSMSGYLTQVYPDIWGTRIIPIGTRSPEETFSLQASAAFIVVPSIWDVFNYACVEGMGSARVVLCSLGAGASCLITDKENGLTFSANDPAALAESLLYLGKMTDSARKRMGDLARKTVRARLDPTHIAEERIKAYKKLLQQGKLKVRPNHWLQNAVRPDQPLEETLAFLDRLPTREILKYTLRRLSRRVLK